MTKKETYEQLLPQIESLVSGETDATAILANVAAALHDAFRFFWVGFYVVRPAAQASADAAPQLVLGPFQGPVACFRISHGRGVCGTAWAQRRTVVVPDVHQFPGHIACSSRSRSEIVVPVMAVSRQTGEPCVVAVLDIDSTRLRAFTATDAKYLEQVAAIVARNLPTP